MATYTQILRQGTYAQYLALTEKDSNLLYFCTDNGKLYKGTVDFTNSFVVVANEAARPTPGVPGKIYYCQAEKTYYACMASGDYQLLGYPVNTTGISASSTNGDTPTSKVVYDYGQTLIADAVTDVAADTDAATLVVTKDGTPSDVVVPGVATGLAATANAGEVSLSKSTGAADVVVVPGVVTGLTNKANTAATVTIAHTTGNDVDLTIAGVVTKPTWNAANRVLTIPVTGDDNVVVDIGKDIFLDPEADHHYDDDTQELVLYLNDGAGGDPTEIRIPVAGIIPIYTGTSTDSATVSVSGTVISASVKLDQAAGNAITLVTGENGGLRVDFSDLQDQIDGLDTRLTTAEGNITSLDTRLTTAEGDIDDLELEVAAIGTAIAWGSFE